MKYKNASIEIVVFVFLVVFLVFFTGYKFYTNSEKIKSNVIDVRFVRDLYLKQEIAENYIEKIGNEIIKKIGKDVIKKNKGVKFKENFKTEFMSYNFEEDYLTDLQKIINEGKFNIFVDNEILEIVINDWEIKDFFEQNKIKKIQIIYSPKISIKFKLEK